MCACAHPPTHDPAPSQTHANANPINHPHFPNTPQRSLNTQDHPYTVATAETGYEDLPLVQRLVPECDSLEAKIEYLVREILAYCIRWCVRFLGVCFWGGGCMLVLCMAVGLTVDGHHPTTDDDHSHHTIT